MNTIREITRNHILVAAVGAWIAAQLIKTVINFFITRKFSAERLIGAGGMPSSHSAMVCALTISMSRAEGVTSPLFALTFLFASVVMYDAMGIRRAAGEQAKTLNRLLDEWDEHFWGHKKDGGFLRAKKKHFLKRSGVKKDDDAPPEEEQNLKEFLGHTPLEVLAGALLGIIIAMLVPR